VLVALGGAKPNPVWACRNGVSRAVVPAVVAVGLGTRHTGCQVAATACLLVDSDAAERLVTGLSADRRDRLQQRFELVAASLQIEVRLDIRSREQPVEHQEEVDTVRIEKGDE